MIITKNTIKYYQDYDKRTIQHRLRFAHPFKIIHFYSKNLNNKTIMGADQLNISYSLWFSPPSLINKITLCPSSQLT